MGSKLDTPQKDDADGPEAYDGFEGHVLHVTAVNWLVPGDFTLCPSLGPDVTTTRVPAIALRNDHPEAMTRSSPHYTGLRPLAERNALRMRTREVRRAGIAAGTRLVAATDQRVPKAGEDASTRYAIVDAVHETPNGGWQRVIVRWRMQSGEGAELGTNGPAPESAAEALGATQATARRGEN